MPLPRFLGDSAFGRTLAQLRGRRVPERPVASRSSSPEQPRREYALQRLRQRRPGRRPHWLRSFSFGCDQPPRSAHDLTVDLHHGTDSGAVVVASMLPARPATRSPSR